MQTKEISSGSRVANNLPPRPDLFIDREEEIHQATVALLQGKVSVVALIGMPGIGKTWLALEIVHRLFERGEFKGGMIWLRSRDLQSSDDLVGKIGMVLEIPTSEVYLRLSSQPCLLVLDGLDETPRYLLEVNQFLETLPAPSKALVTSRQVSPLPRQCIVLQVGAFDEQTATDLFLALAARYGIKAPDKDRQKIADIVRTLDYHPLALRLAASLIQGLSLDELPLRIQESAANLAERDGRLEDAIKYWSEMLETLEQHSGKYGDKAKAEYNLGRLLAEQGRWYDGLRLLEESLAIRRQGDDLDARADAIYQIARTHHLMGNLDEARLRYRDALRLYDRTGNRRGVAACRAGLGRLTIQTGWLDDAMHELEQARQIYTELGDEQRIVEIEEVVQLANQIKES